MKLEADFQPFFSHGGSLRASWYGDCLPSRDFPMLVDLALQGRFPLDKFVTERISLDDVEQSFEKMHQRRRAAFGGDPVTRREGRRGRRAPDDVRPVPDRRQLVRRRQQRLDHRRLVARSSCSTPRTTPRRSRRRSATATSWPSCAPTRTTTTSTPRRRSRSAFDAPILLNPDDRVIWNLTYPDREPDGEIADGETFTIAGIDLRAIHTPGHSPGSTVLLRARHRHAVLRRHPVQRRPGRHRAVVLGLRRAHRAAGGQGVLAARRHHRAHRARRHDEGRRRGRRASRSTASGATEPARRRSIADSEYPADPYPGVAPGFSFVHLDAPQPPARPAGPSRRGRVDRGRASTSTAGSPTAARRRWPPACPVLAFGSNRCPSKLTWLREHLGLAGPVVVLRARVEGLAAVWAAGLRARDGARPGDARGRAPGAVETHAVWMATPGPGRRARPLRGTRASATTWSACATGRGRHRGRRTPRPRLDLLGGRPGARAAAGRRRARCACRDVDQDAARDARRRARRRSTRAPVTAQDGAPDPDGVARPGVRLRHAACPGRRAWPLIAPHVVGAPGAGAWLPGRVHDTGRGYPALRQGGPGRARGHGAPAAPTRSRRCRCSTSTRARTTGGCARVAHRSTDGRRPPGSGPGGESCRSRPWPSCGRRPGGRVRTATKPGRGRCVHRRRGPGRSAPAAGTGGIASVRRLGRLRPPPGVGPADEEHDPGEERDPGEGQGPRPPRARGSRAGAGRRARPAARRPSTAGGSHPPPSAAACSAPLPHPRMPHSARDVARPPVPLRRTGSRCGPGPPRGRGR